MTYPLIRHDTYTFKAPATAIELKGFVENGVTYESHTFHVDFGKPGYLGLVDATIYVRHGGGWESMPVRHMIATALRSLLDAGVSRAAFFLCFELFEQVRNAYGAGSGAIAREYQKAFVEGRLKKRKRPGLDKAKVWIEPEAGGFATRKVSVSMKPAIATESHPS
jgi:hypothetical protein